MEKGILALLDAFQAGYTARDIGKIDTFMGLFTEDAEVIGTNGSFPGEAEWYLDRSGAAELVRGDWESWGDVALDIGRARIQRRGGVGWLSVPATVTKRIGEENYQSYLEYVKSYMETPDLSAKQKLLNILRGGTNTLFELNRGETFIWPVRITAVVVEDGAGWRFAQMTFSFSTTYFPDVRLLDR